MKFEFINHSCFNIVFNQKSLTVDPWIDGLVFNKSWALLSSTTKDSMHTVNSSDFIWFSHEHPDHFNPQNIKNFPQNKTYLFQKTKDKRVINYLKKFSKKVVELESNNIFSLSNNFTIQAFPFQDLDSFCVIRVGGLTILNLNDCHIKKTKELSFIKENVGVIDILMVQFSYAIGKTNKNDSFKRKKIANEILENLNLIISYLKPSKVIPFASFCYFSRRDNFHHNDSINKIDDTIKYLKINNPYVDFLCFYPGDVWNFKSQWNNDSSFHKYNEDYKKISPLLDDDDTVEFSVLFAASKKFILNTKTNNNLFHIYKFLNKKFYEIFFKLTDSNIFLKFDFDNGLQAIKNINSNDPICELTSGSLKNLFTSGYGYDSLTIGGRYEANTFGEKCLNKIFKFQTKNYQNQFYNLNEVVYNMLTKLLKRSRYNPKR